MFGRLRWVWLGAVAVGLAATLAWLTLWPRFEPGGGGVDEFPPLMASDGAAVLRLRLTVWGGGGPIQGRFSQVTAVVVPALNGAASTASTATPPAAALRLPARAASDGDAHTQWVEFALPAGTLRPGQPLDYHFEVTLDGQTTRIPPHHRLALP